MGFWKTSKKVAGHIVDVRVDKWIGLDSIKQTTRGIYGSAKELVTPEQAARTETFEQALERLNLTEADLAKQKIQFTRLFYFFVVLAFTVFGYGIYIALQGNLLGFLIAFALTAYALSQAFRYHFWVFQITKRKLGCSIKDWLNDDSETPKSKLPDKPKQ